MKFLTPTFYLSWLFYYIATLAENRLWESPHQFAHNIYGNLFLVSSWFQGDSIHGPFETISEEELEKRLQDRMK